MSAPFLVDPDLTLWHGDALDVLQQLPAGSVDCCVTSPPYWGLRDYGADGQIGLEPTPEAFVAALVGVFQEVRRVLADDGTLWLNLGDSYASSPPGNKGTPDEAYASSGLAGARAGSRYMQTLASSVGTKRNTVCAGLKPKDLVGIPWRVAFALQADGWYLRSDIIWAKPNPMPESVTDRPTKAHEYVFLLSKSPRYFFDQEAVREPAEWSRWGDQTVGAGSNPNGWIKARTKAATMNVGARRKLPPQSLGGQSGNSYGVERDPSLGRNVRSVWEIATQPYAEAHFATFPLELPRRCIAAGCPEWVCGTCGKARERIVERIRRLDHTTTQPSHVDSPYYAQDAGGIRNGVYVDTTTVGWSDCGHGNYRPGTVLDPFMGSGTTALAARGLNRRSVGIEMNAEYCALAARRLQQLSLLAEPA